jgi:hypothetical protein
MRRYAENTEVSSDRSRAEIEGIIRRYGASQFLYGWEANKAVIGFACQRRHVRFELPLPDRDNEQFAKTPAGRRSRSPAAQEAAWEQSCRQRWRALGLVIKAKLEAVETGITTFDDEFLAHIVLSNGQTLGQYAIPRLDSLSGNGRIAGLLPGPEKAHPRGDAAARRGDSDHG